MLTEFKSFLEACIADKKFVQLDSVKDMLAGIENTHYFVVPDVYSGTSEDYDNFMDKHIECLNIDGIRIPESMDLPFQRCFFQCIKNSMNYNNTFTYEDMAKFMNFDVDDVNKSIKEQYNISLKDEIPSVTMHHHNIYVYEVEPKYIRVVATVELANFNLIFPISYSFKDGKLGVGKSDFERIYEETVIESALTVIKLLETINHKSWTVVSNDTPVKVKTRVGRNLTKYKYKPSNIVYVYSEHKFRKHHPELSHRIINKPNYAYEVRGHWRKLQYGQIGKDREGLRGVKGYTWVIPFIKGEGEVMKKVRIVK